MLKGGGGGGGGCGDGGGGGYGGGGGGGDSDGGGGGSILSVTVTVKYPLPLACYPQMNPTVCQLLVPITTVPHTLPQPPVAFYNFVSPLTHHPINKCTYTS